MYGFFYVICFFVWAIPLVDGVRGQNDMIYKQSQEIEKDNRSDRAYGVMQEHTMNENYDIIKDG